MEENNEKEKKKKTKRKQVKQNRLIRIYFSFSYKMFAIFNKSQLIFNSSKKLKGGTREYLSLFEIDIWEYLPLENGDI